MNDIAIRLHGLSSALSTRVEPGEAATAQAMTAILARKGYDAHWVDSAEAARYLVESLIKPGQSIALGGSTTLDALNILELVRRPAYRFFDRYQPVPFAQTVEVMRESMLADVLITGVNAITRNGELVSIDSTGNRVAGMIFGPRKVIVVAGTNKIVANLDAALARIRHIAPHNAARVGHKVPCVESGVCEDCELQASVCNSIGIVTNGRKFKDRISVVLIAGEYGY